MIVPARFNGPPGSANGGYACGLFSEALGGGFEITLLLPPPLDTQLDIVGDELRHGDVVVARARRAVHSDEDIPEPVSPAAAEEASKRYAGFEQHAYASCFTCGPARQDGLGIFPGPVEGREGLVAAPWTPETERMIGAAQLAAMKPGVPVSQIFETAMRVTRANGMPHYERNHVGHGIGLEPYDPPTLNAVTETALEPGMVFCVETPYYEHGWGGVQVEDAVEVTATGARLLTRSGQELAIIG